MNKAQKEVQQAHLDEEKKLIRLLQAVYERAKKDCEQKIRELSTRTDLENIQSIVYQKQYQEALKKQLESVLNNLNSQQFTSVAEYLQNCYTDGFVGTMYDLQYQGIPLILPIRQDQVVQALQTESKLSQGLYDRGGEDTNYLKKSIRAELSRGIANGSTWNEMAVHIAKGMVSPFQRSFSNAIRIARTEGHRIQQQSALNALEEAKEKGANSVKQWDATLDGRTRPDHQVADGQIRELDEMFDVGGEKMRAPGIGGSARNVCNCRCCMLPRPRWMLDEDELNKLKERAAFFGLDKTKDFEDFKQKYLKLPDDADTMKVETPSKPTGSEDLIYDAFFKTLNELKVEYNAVDSHKKKMTSDEIIKALSGGDRTSGSCASLGLAYIGQKQGWNVLDFRGGESQGFFSNTYNIKSLFETKGIKKITAKGACTATVGKNLLKQCEVGKEYYLYVGRHAAIVRKTVDEVLQYLELQSPTQSGWHDFNGNVRYTLVDRFGCSSESNKWSQEIHGMIDINDSDFNTDDFKALLGYINTAESEQKKGKYGTVK